MKRAIGYTVTRYWCRKCAPEGIIDGGDPLREGDDHGIPFYCDDCGELLAPCDHEWEEWLPAFGGGEIRFCAVADCLEVDRREV